MAMVLKSRSSRNAGEKRKKQFVSEVTTVGAFAVQFVAAYEPEKDASGKAVKGKFRPTGELSMAIQVGDGFPATRLKWNPSAQGPLADIADDLEGFTAAVMAAAQAWADDAKYGEAQARLKAYLADGAPVEAPEEEEAPEEPATELEPSLVAGLVCGAPK